MRQVMQFTQRSLTQIGLVVLAIGILSESVVAQEAPVYNENSSIARNWNEALLFAIRRDFARPTVHARNLFHTAGAMYDGWAVFDDTASTYFLGRTQSNGTVCAFTPAQRAALIDNTDDVTAARKEVISYAMYRLLNNRFATSPGEQSSVQRFDDLMQALSYDTGNTMMDLDAEMTPATLGNYLANCVITFGQSDGSNEQNNFDNQFYTPINTPLNPATPGTPGLVDPNRWQPLEIENFIDQSGNPSALPEFLGAEWGRVTPFALSTNDLTDYTRDGSTYPVYHDPGPPALLDDNAADSTDYLWGHTLVALWSSHLDPADGVMLDISPATLGNTTELPTTLAGLRDFYKPLEGGSVDNGYAVNPVTNLPYQQQIVPRGDYARVLAEFWADGPDSETPPGHWFSIYNDAVIDHPDFDRRFGGSGDVLDKLEFDVRTYFILGGAMHDSAITAWGIKGWYDYIRPISALRYMASLGQSTDTSADNFHTQGIPLENGYIEIVEPGDVLAGNGGVNIGKIKVRAWRGPNFIRDPDTDIARVGWILVENWWPYQRPTFVTPPFAGYVSGHSTFSRAAAEVLTKITGSEFFPGGMGEFVAKKNEFLVFEEGPSVDIRLQWATYRDASDQTSLSRIWGGIHPPVDDVPGRRIGIAIADDAFALAMKFFSGNTDDTNPGVVDDGINNTTGGNGGCVIGRSNRGIDPVFFILILIAVWGLFRSRPPLTREDQELSTISNV